MIPRGSSIYSKLFGNVKAGCPKNITYNPVAMGSTEDKGSRPLFHSMSIADSMLVCGTITPVTACHSSFATDVVAAQRPTPSPRFGT